MKKKFYLNNIAHCMVGCVLMVLALVSTSHAQTMSRQNKLIIEKGIQYQSWMRVDDTPEYPLYPPLAAKSIVGRTGRYVRIQLGTTEPLDLAELQVFSGGVNIAQGKTTIQSSTQGSAGSNLAVDGNTNGTLSSGSVAQTIADRSRIEPWWQVDLGSVVNIDSIKVWRRTDANLIRLKGAYLFVSDNAYTSNTLAGILAQSGVSRYVGAGVDYYPLGADLTYTNMAPVYYEQPMYNYTIAKQHPSLQWGLAVFPDGTHTGGVRAPSSFEQSTDFLNSLHKSNIGNLSSICFGDEENYSTGMQTNLAQWYAASKTLYPNVLVHNNQWFGQYSESQLRTYMQGAKPDMLTYDWYYFYSHVTPTTGTSYGNMLRDMMRYRRVAMEGYDGTGNQPIIYGGYLQAYNGYGYKRNNTANPGGMTYTYVPSESEYNVGAYSFMLMGAKWLSVWRLLGKYPGEDAYAWQDDAGNWLPTYYTYSRIGKEVKSLSPHLSRLQSTDIRFIPGQNKASGTVATNAMPAGIAAWAADADPYIKSITATNLVPATNFGLKGDVAIGYFRPVVGINNTAGITMAPIEHRNAKYFMLMNGLVKSNTYTGNPSADTIVGKAVLCKQKIAMSIDFGSNPIDTLYRVNRTTGVVQQMNLTLVSGTQYSLVDTLDGGMADLFYWKNAGRPLANPITGTALNLNNGTISAGNVTSLSGTSKFTLEGWVKFNTLSAWNTIFYRYGSGTNRIALSSNATNGLHVVVSNGSSNFANSPSNIITAGEWFHVAMVYDGTQATNDSKLKLYVNGVAQTLVHGGGTGVIPTTAGTTTAPLIVGTDGGNLFNGVMDEVRIWNTALSATDLNTWKNKTLGSCHPNVGNLQVYWPLNNSSNPAVATPGLTTTNTGTVTNGTYVTGGWATNASACPVGQNALSISASATISAGVSELNGASKFTIESWTKFTNGADWATVFGKIASTTNRTAIQTLANGSVYVLLGNGANTYGYTAAGTITTGQWYHVAVVFDGTQTTNANRLKLYINGVQKALTFSGTIPATTGTSAPGLSFWQSSLDEVRIWDTAVSGANLLAWKDKALGSCHPNVANLKLYWQLNDDANPATATPGLSTSYAGNITNATYITGGQATGSSGCSGGLMATSAKNTLMMISPADAGTTRVYPNPITGNQLLQVDISAENAQNASIEVFDGLGRNIYRSERKLDKGINHATLDLSSKPVGLYIIKIDNGNETKQFKVIKN
jgi:hypothetical protein